MNERELFMAAVQIQDADERSAYLDRACAGEAALRRRVDILLAAFDRVGNFLQQPACIPGAASGVSPSGPWNEGDPSAGAGAVIGPYKLLELIGEGGMGVVWMAQQQEPVRRLVAVKLIKAGVDSEEVLARFEAERQALALMDHPNIARVLDGGATAAGRPYLVMDLVKGVPITKFCDQYRYTLRQRLELFIPVCQAIQHAHQKGIIHRDLKPSNVLVALYDGEPVVKVIDFGVAKATGQQLTERTLVTGFGKIVGTPEYMSPEQAELNNLDIDTRSDVYSLGVLLYELLTGSPPFNRRELNLAGLLEMLRVIREQEPSRPSTKLSTADGLPALATNRGTDPSRLTRGVRGELDWIVMKALEKDRNRRYETANAFAMDVRRHLEDEPVQACPPSASYRLRKFAWRNRGLVLMAAGVVTSLLLGIGVAGWQAIVATRARERAEGNFVLARESVEKYLGTVTEDPDLSKSDFHKLRKKLLESAVPFLKRIAEQNSDDPTVQDRRGRAFHRLALVHHTLGEYGSAVRDCEAMSSCFSRLANDFPAVPYFREELAVSYVQLGRSLANLGKRAEAESAFLRGQELFERLVADSPTVATYRQNLLSLHNSRGLLATSLGKRPEAEAAYRRALELAEQLAAADPTVPKYRQELARCLNNLGILLGVLGRVKEQEEAYRRALDLRERLAAEDPTKPGYRSDLASTYKSLGILLATLGRRPEAEVAHRRALDLRERLAADFPSVPEYRQDLAQSHDMLGTCLASLGKRPEAEAAVRRALDLYERLVAEFPTVPDHRNGLATCHNSLGLRLSSLGKRSEAEAAYRRSTDILERLAIDFPAVPRYRSSLAKSHNNLGGMLEELGRRSEAEAAYRRAVDLRERLVADSPAEPDIIVELGGSYCNLGNVCLRGNQPGTGLAWYARAIERLEPVVAREPRLATAREFLFNSYAGRSAALNQLGRHAEALTDLDRALELKDRRGEQLRPLRAETRLRALWQNRDATGCLAAAAEYDALEPTGAVASYNAACLRALCAAVIPLDPRTSQADATRLSREQADHAMTLLQKAVAAGYRGVNHIRSDKDLDGLREREDFRALLAELEVRQKARPAPKP